MHVDYFLIIESDKSIQLSASMAKKMTWLDANAAKQAVIIQP